MNLDTEWHRLTIWTDDENYDGTQPEENPKGAIITVDEVMSMREYRAKYDMHMGDKSVGELFFGFGQRSGNMWLRNLEWRLPSVK